MAYDLLPTRRILQTLEETDSMPSYFLDNFFTGETILSTEQEIDFEKVYRDKRKLAPFVAPMSKGKAVFEKGSRTYKFAPAFSKMLDTYNPQKAIQRRVGHKLDLVAPTPDDNYRAWVIEVSKQQYNRYLRLCEWMAAQAILNASVVLIGEGFEQRVVDFDRASGHTVVLGAGSRWGDSGVSITDNIQSWSDTMHLAAYGGAPTRMTMGVTAWSVFRKDAEIQKRLDTTIRGTQTNIKTGLTGQGEVKYVGNLDGYLEIYVYSDYYHDDNGNVVPFMDARDILLTAPNVNGIKAYGMIPDVLAQFQAMPFFIRNWIDEGEDSIPVVNSKGAPMFAPINQNATFRARVVA